MASIAAWQSAGAVAETFRLAFRCYVVWLVVRHVLRDRTITLDTAAGSARAHFLLGMIWTDLFIVLERWRSGSFHVLATWTIGSDRDLRLALAYFSFATLTTLAPATSIPTTHRQEVSVTPRR